MTAGRLVILTNLYVDHRTGQPFNGGEQRIYRELIRQARLRGWTAVVLQEDRKEARSFQVEEGVVAHAIPRKHWWGRMPRPRFGRHMVERFLPPHEGPQILLSSYPDYLSELTHLRPWIYQHGVGWDGNTASDRRKTLAEHLKLWPHLEGLIAVDTNYPNVIAAHLGPKEVEPFYAKVKFIPNFQEMTPTPLPALGPEGVRFLFPRNFVVGRGIFLVAEAASRLWAKGLRFHLTLCGQPIREDAPEAARMRELLGPWEAKGCLTFTQLPFDRMHEAFQACHVTLVPTLMSEGTSLSCLEAFGTGRPVLGTWVGGLQNLLLDRQNGRMLSPSVDALAEAMEEVIRHPERLAPWRDGALATAARFSKQVWDQAIQAWLASREDRSPASA